MKINISKYNNAEDIPRLYRRRGIFSRSVGVQSPTERKQFFVLPLLVKSRALNFRTTLKYMSVATALTLLTASCQSDKNINERKNYEAGLAAESSTDQATEQEETRTCSVTETVSFPDKSETDTEASELVSDFSEEVSEPSESVSDITEAVIINDEKLDSVMNDNGFSYSDLEESGQLVVVESSGASCAVSLYEKNDGWIQKYSCNGIVGKNGVIRNSTEGDYCTPFGLYSLGFAFGTEVADNLKVEYRQIENDCYWVDDPLSEYYNQWVKTDNPQWNSAEHLADYPDSYHYALVINYNMDPVVPGAGSAIFLHCAAGEYTAGCVAVPESDMKEIYNWIDSEKKPMILIV